VGGQVDAPLPVAGVNAWATFATSDPAKAGGNVVVMRAQL